MLVESQNIWHVHIAFLSFFLVVLGMEPRASYMLYKCSPTDLHSQPLHTAWGKKNLGWAPVGHTCNPSYLEDWDVEDGGLRWVQGNSSRDPISKITRVKWRWGLSRRVPALQVGTLSWTPRLSLSHTHTHTHTQKPWRTLNFITQYPKEFRWGIVFASS
jgi:hypothetical protein